MFIKWTVVRFMYIIIIDDKSRHDEIGRYFIKF